VKKITINEGPRCFRLDRSMEGKAEQCQSCGIRREGQKCSVSGYLEKKDAQLSGSTPLE